MFKCKIHVSGNVHLPSEMSSTTRVLKCCRFFAKPSKAADGSVNLMRWECGIPGKAGTSWAGAIYGVVLEFNDDFPIRPPAVKFDPPLFHPNVFPSGAYRIPLLCVHASIIPPSGDEPTCFVVAVDDVSWTVSGFVCAVLVTMTAHVGVYLQEQSVSQSSRRRKIGFQPLQ